MFICSSRSEGYSTVVTEALILGIPVITTDCSGMDELLDNGKYGMIVANNYHALEDGIRKLITDNQLLELYKNKAQVRRCHFSINELMKPIEYLLNE